MWRASQTEFEEIEVEELDDEEEPHESGSPRFKLQVHVVVATAPRGGKRKR